MLHNIINSIELTPFGIYVFDFQLKSAFFNLVLCMRKWWENRQFFHRNWAQQTGQFGVKHKQDLCHSINAHRTSHNAHESIECILCDRKSINRMASSCRSWVSCVQRYFRISIIIKINNKSIHCNNNNNSFQSNQKHPVWCALICMEGFAPEFNNQTIELKAHQIEPTSMCCQTCKIKK